MPRCNGHLRSPNSKGSALESLLLVWKDMMVLLVGSVVPAYLYRCYSDLSLGPSMGPGEVPPARASQLRCRSMFLSNLSRYR